VLAVALRSDHLTARRRESFAEGRARRAEIDDPAVVLEAASRFLEARQRSVAEVRRRLTSAGYREELVTTAIERLGDLGMLDDAGFAAQWVESRDRARPRGERALRMELRRKGIDTATIDGAMVERADREPGAAPDDAAADRLLDRHRRALERIADPRRRRNRAYATLARHGFDPDTATRAIRRADAETAEGLDDSEE
jgi:regulatory protein